MSLKDWREDQNLIERIAKAVQIDNVSHAYIFEADSTVDKMQFAKDFVKAVLCKHAPGYGCDNCITCAKVDHDNLEDIHLIEAEYNQAKSAKSVRDEAVAGLIEAIKTMPNGERNIAIISDADTMTVRAQNRLLKTLEEPTEGTIIILLSENSDNLLDTIKSRCIKYNIYGGMKEEGEFFNGAKDLVNAIIDRKDFYTLKEIISGCVKSRDDAFCLLDSMERIYRNLLLGKDSRATMIRREKIFEGVALIEEARRDLIIKVNYNYALRDLVLKL